MTMCAARVKFSDLVAPIITLESVKVPRLGSAFGVPLLLGLANTAPARPGPCYLCVDGTADAAGFRRSPSVRFDKAE